MTDDRYDLESVVDIDPSEIVGWRDGGPFDTREAEGLGFRYLKGQARYAHIGPHPESMDGLYGDSKSQYLEDAQHAAEVMSGIKAHGFFDDPIVVYRVEGGYVLLDGAMRLSAVAAIRSRDPSFMPTVSAMVFSGTPDEARAEMLARCARGRKRPLRLAETCDAVAFMLSMGMSEQEVAATQGGAHRVGYVRRLMKLSGMMHEVPGMEARMSDMVASGMDEEAVVMALTSSPREIAARAAAVKRTPMELALSRLQNAREEYADHVRQCMPPEVANRMARDMGQAIGDLVMQTRSALMSMRQD